MNGNGDAKKPPMRLRDIYVEYIYRRKCRNNPSINRFGELPELHQHFLLDRMRDRSRQQPTKRSKAK